MSAGRRQFSHFARAVAAHSQSDRSHDGYYIGAYREHRCKEHEASTFWYIRKMLKDFSQTPGQVLDVTCSDEALHARYYVLVHKDNGWGLQFVDDCAKRLIEFGIGLMDLVKKPTRGVEELTRGDFAEGRIVLSQKLEEFAPRVVAFHGKMTYEQFAQRKCMLGLQKQPLYGARVFVLPSASGANAVAQKDKLKHFWQLARLMKQGVAG